MRKRTKRVASAAALAVLGLGTATCVGWQAYGDPTSAYSACAMQDPATWASRLSETGLYASVGDETLAEGVFPYTPNFALWTDGARKRRWVFLPPGTTIDTRDADDWVFPQGTKLWKEFSRDGVRIETRLLEKVGPTDDDWAAIAYLWNEDQSDAIAVPEGIANTHGTTHDVPSAASCAGCHDGRRSRVLGFSAIQLGGSDPADTTLARLEAEGRLSHPLPAQLDPPGDATTRTALGYLHANCAHCHNGSRPETGAERCYDPETPELDLWLTTNALDRVEDTAAYRTLTREGLIEPGRPGDSWLLRIMDGEGEPFISRMPPLGTEERDVDGTAALSAWISALPNER